MGQAAASDTRVAGFRSLVERFGADAVATALLVKWQSDEDADEKWLHLAAKIGRAQPTGLNFWDLPRETRDELRAA